MTVFDWIALVLLCAFGWLFLGLLVALAIGRRIKRIREDVDLWQERQPW